MNKAELRNIMINKLSSFNENMKTTYEQNILDTLMRTELWEKADIIGITISKGFEWNTKHIIEEAWKQKKQVCVPKCHPKTKTMTFYKLDSFNQLEIVYYNLQEPKIDETECIDKQFIDLLIVPGLAYSREGYRVGFGGGFYDRFLSNFYNSTLSLLHPDQIVNDLPVDSHDIKVNYLLTSEGFITN